MSNAAKKIESENLENYTAEDISNLNAMASAISRVQAVIEFNTDGIILSANENFLKTLGYELSEIQGKHHRIFCDASYTQSLNYRSFWEKLNRGEFDTGEYKRFGKNGREVWINASYNPVFDGNGKVTKIVKFASDITREKLTNLEFAAKMEAISKSQAVIEFNLDGTVISANENFLKTLNYELSEIKGKHHRNFCDPEYANSAEYRAFWEKLNRGEFDSGEYRRLGKGGKVVWINASYNPILDVSGRPYKVVKFATDVTDMKRMIESVEQTATALSAASIELTATATQMSGTANKTSQESQAAAMTAEEVAIGVQTVATNVEEMVASIKEIARSTNESSQMSKFTLSKAQESNATIVKLGVSSQEIGDVIKVISSIAQQTNLLALNATIEAARAGEAGKGFAVVANEVKELAKQTAKATNDITNKIGAIQSDTKSAVEAISGISQAVEKLNGIAGVIAAAVEEQTATTNEISRVVVQSKKGVENIAGKVKTVSLAASESTASSNQTLSASQELSKLASKLNALVKKGIMKKIKVLIADDSVVYRTQIRSALEAFAFVEIAGVASHGRIALERLAQTPVDLLILDLEMPEMDGIQTLTALKEKEIACKTLVFSSVSKRGAEITLEALRLGASDFIAKPGASDFPTTGSVNPSSIIKALLEPKLLSLFPQDLQIPVPEVTAPSVYPKLLWDLFRPEIVVLGSSTGGPTVLEKIFSQLRGPLQCPIFITQHMPPVFTAALAERLGKMSGIPTCEATDGMLVENNHVYVAPGNFHMSVTGTRLQTRIVLDQGPAVHSVRPAVNPLFESSARIFGHQCLGIVLTGMGSDGKEGAESIKKHGGAVIIQEQQSCVVFGMPGAVMAAGAYDQVFTPDRIIFELQNKVGTLTQAMGQNLGKAAGGSYA